jgi:hypothetical protein
MIMNQQNMMAEDIFAKIEVLPRGFLAPSDRLIRQGNYALPLMRRLRHRIGGSHIFAWPVSI